MEGAGFMTCTVLFVLFPLPCPCVWDNNLLMPAKTLEVVRNRLLQGQCDGTSHCSSNSVSAAAYYHPADENLLNLYPVIILKRKCFIGKAENVEPIRKSVRSGVAFLLLQ